MMRNALLIVLGGILLFGGNRQAATADPAQDAPTTVTDTKKDSPTKESTAAKAEKPASTEKKNKDEVLLTPPPPPGAPVPVKTRMVRALLDALEGIQGLEPEHKDGVTRSLMAADEELSRVLGGNSKRLILQANKKPPLLIVGEDPRPVRVVPEQTVPPPTPGFIPPPVVPPVVPGTVQRPIPAASGPVKHSMVQSLLQTLDAMPGEDPQAKAELRKLLLEADKNLNQTAGDKL